MPEREYPVRGGKVLIVWNRTWTWAVAVLLGAATAAAEPSAPDPYSGNLGNLTIEELLEIPVSVGAKKSRPVSATRAAVYVVTAEELARYGITSLPEALRLVPGLQVARIDAAKYAVGVRGFNDRFANKLLVLVDGRSIYSPLFSGVLWETQGLPVAEIDRIEVIRGPGAALWGANAVNGVINVITRGAARDGGTSISYESDGRNDQVAYARRDGPAGASGAWAAYGQLREGGTDADDAAAPQDAYRRALGGLRADLSWSSVDRLSLDASYGEGRFGEMDDTFVSLDGPPYFERTAHTARSHQGHLLAHWRHATARGGESRVQAYFDHSWLQYNALDARHNTFDLEFEQRVPLSGGHELVWGTGVRIVDALIHGTYEFDFQPDQRQDLLLSGFAQDEWTLAGGALTMAGGAKFEHNSFTGLELQPSVSAMWTPHERQHLWGSIARAVRTPASGDVGVNTLLDITAADDPDNPAGMMLQTRLLGSRSLESEVLWAFEAGYRVQPAVDLTVDLALFHNEYSRVNSFEPGEPFLGGTEPEPYLVVPVRVGNGLEGRTRGVEVAVDWNPAPWWLLRGSFTALDVELQRRPDSLDVTSNLGLGQNPQRTATLRSSFVLSHALSINGMLSHASQLEQLEIPAWTELDLRLGWRPRPGLELACGGRSLLNEEHIEFQSQSIIVSSPVAVQRVFYGSVKWGF